MGIKRTIAVWFLVAATFAQASFNYYSSISIKASQVPSTLTDFPVLVAQTDNRFKSVSNGGHVQSSSGYDIRPYTSSSLSTAITGYELERYNASTGEVVMWVKVSSLTSSSTPIYLAYGDSSITTDGSSSTTWSNSFVVVYHLKDGTTLSLADSANGITLTNNNSVTATTGKIDGGANFASASSQYLKNTSTVEGTAMTWSAWVKPTTWPSPGNYGAMMLKNSGNTAINGLVLQSDGTILGYYYLTGGQNSYGGTHSLSTGTWYYITLSCSSAGIAAYVNGASDYSHGGSTNYSPPNNTLTLGRDDVNGRYFNGAEDEVRIASVVRSADWITAEYNEGSPSTFETLDAEVAVSTSATSSFFLLFP